MSTADDDAIKRRLLIEGDGGSDDKRVGNLLKLFQKYTNSTEPLDSEEGNATYQRMLSMLAQTEMAMLKSYNVYKMNLQEQENYQALNDKIEESIKTAYEKINACKSELQQAKRIRKNRQQYDAMAQEIQRHPDRQDTLRQLEALDKELESLKETRESLYQKLSLRKKQFHLLVSAIHELQKIIEDDETGTDQQDTSDSQMDTS